MPRRQAKPFLFFLATLLIAAQMCLAEPLSKQAPQDLPNFHKVHDFLYRSGEPSSKGLASLKDKGIKTIIDLRAATPLSLQEEREAAGLGLKYIRLPMSSEPPTDEQVRVFLSTVSEAKEKGPGEAVLVHCAHGSDRTGCMVGIWRAKYDGWDYDTCYQEMRKYYFTPKFTKLSGTVKQFCLSEQKARALNGSR